MIKIITALFCEAKPIINYFKLKLVQNTPFPIYENKEFILAISGVGSLNASTCTTHLHHYRDQNSLWLNIGTAGHSKADIGKLFLVSKASHENLKKAFYPYLPVKHLFDLMPLVSIEKPSQNYLPHALCDMEGYGFYFAALKFSSLERVQALKIVSDNSSVDIKKITKEDLSCYIEQNLSLIEELINLMLRLKITDTQHPEIQLIENHLHFTETQRHKLISQLNLLHKHRLNEYSFEALKEFTCPKKLLTYLENEIFNLPLIKS